MRSARPPGPLWRRRTARYTRHGTSATPACPAVKAVSLDPCPGRDGVRSCRRAYGGVWTLAFSPLRPLLAFQQGLFSLPAEACHTRPAGCRPAVSFRSPLGALVLSLRLSVVHMFRILTKNQLEWF